MPTKNRRAFIGDPHGCYKTFRSLVEGLDVPVTVLGDLVDRGQNSADVVQYCMEKQRAGTLECLMGNHERMLVRGTEFAYNFRTVEDRRLWLYNGGHETIASYGDKVGISPEEDPWAVVNSPLFQEHRTWMAQLPFYLEYPDLVTPEGRTVFASHACPSGNLEQDLQSLDILWNRNAPSPKTLPGKFSIYGHTVKREPILTDWHANLDTGATFQGFGKLTCLIVPDMKIIQVDAFPEEQFGFKTPTVPKTKEADPEAFEV